MARACTLLLFDMILVSLGIEDLKKRKVKDQYPAAVLLLSLVSLAVFPEISLISRVWGMFVISIPMLFLALLLPGSFGGGDVKLVFACGAFLGRSLVIQGVGIAILLAGIYCLWLIFIKKENRKVQFAFGPFLSIGFILVTGNL